MTTSLLSSFASEIKTGLPLHAAIWTVPLPAIMACALTHNKSGQETTDVSMATVKSNLCFALPRVALVQASMTIALLSIQASLWLRQL